MDDSKEQYLYDDDDDDDNDGDASYFHRRQQHLRVIDDNNNQMIELTKTTTTTSSSCSIPDDNDDDENDDVDDDDTVTRTAPTTTYDFLIKDSTTSTSIKQQKQQKQQLHNNNNNNNYHHYYYYYKTGLLICSCLYTFLYMGAFFGYGPMMLMLQNDNAFFVGNNNNNKICSSSNNNNNTTTTTTFTTIIICDNNNEQNRSLLNVHFTAMLLQVLSPFIGHLYDIFGPLTMMIYTTIMAFIGIILLFVSRKLQIDWILYPSFAFLGMTSFSPMIVITGSIFGGSGNKKTKTKTTTKNNNNNNNNDYETIPIEDEEEQKALMMTTMTTKSSSTSSTATISSTDDDDNNCNDDDDDSNNDYDDSNDDDDTDDTSQRRAIALLNNLFDAGSVTYLILWKVQQITKVSFETIVLGYGLVGLIVFGGATIFWKLYLTTTTTTTTTTSSTTIVIHDDNDDDDDDKKEDSTIEHNKRRRRKEDNDADNDDDWKKELLRSGSFLWLVFFFVFHQCRNLFMLTSAEAFLDYLGDDDNHYIAIFTGLMSASIIGFPVVDFVLGNYGYHIGLQTINLLAIVHGTIQTSTTNLNIQIVGFVVFAMYRSFLFSVTFAFLLVLVQQKENVLGKANGIMFVSAGFASLWNIPLGNVTMQIFNGNFFFPNLLYTIMTIPFFYAAYQTTRTTK